MVTLPHRSKQMRIKNYDVPESFSALKIYLKADSWKYFFHLFGTPITNLGNSLKENLSHQVLITEFHLFSTQYCIGNGYLVPETKWAPKEVWTGNLPSWLQCLNPLGHSPHKWMNQWAYKNITKIYLNFELLQLCFWMRQITSTYWVPRYSLSLLNGT